MKLYEIVYDASNRKYIVVEVNAQSIQSVNDEGITVCISKHTVKTFASQMLYFHKNTAYYIAGVMTTERRGCGRYNRFVHKG